MERIVDSLRQQEVASNKRKGNEPLRGEALIEKVCELYPNPDQPVFYRSDDDLHRLVSHQTLNNLLLIAQRAQVVPIPYKRAAITRGRSYYPRDELIAVLCFWEQLKGLNINIGKHARRLRREQGQLLTIREAAERLGIPAKTFRSLVLDGEIVFSPKIVTESITRVGSPWRDKRGIIPRGSLVDVDLWRAVEKWRNRYRSLDNLTYGVFIKHREFFATVLEVAKGAGLNTGGSRIPKLSEILAQAGIRIVKLPRSKKTVHVLSLDDLKGAVEVLKQYTALRLIDP